MFQVVLTQRDAPDETLSTGTSLALIVKDQNLRFGIDKEMIRRQLGGLVKPGVSISITPVRLVTAHHYEECLL